MVKKVKNVELKPSKAKEFNRNSNKMAYMIGAGGSPNNPEFIYPEELKPAIVTASADAYNKKKIEKEVAKIMSNKSGLVGAIGGGIGQNLGDKSLQNIAAGAIGLPLLVANPITAIIAPELLKGAGHAAKVMMNPASAETTLGALTSTAADAYFITKGLERNSQLINNWQKGQFNHGDIPEFGLNMLGAVPFTNVLAKTADRGVDFISFINKAQQSAKANKLMTQRDPGLAQTYINSAGNAIEPVQVNPRVAAIYNQQISGKLASQNTSKLTKEEFVGKSRHDRTNKDRLLERIKEKYATEGVAKSSVYSSLSKRATDIAESLNKGKKIGSAYTGQNVESSRYLARYMTNSYLDEEGEIFKNLKDFAKSLSDDIITLPELISKNGEVPPLVNLARGYYDKLGINTYGLTDSELAKIVQYEYNMLNDEIIGIGKDLLLYHGVGGSNPNPLELYDLYMQGKFTDNMGRSGPGYYLSNAPSYSGRSSRFNIQPYLINNAKKAVSAEALGYSGYPGNHIKSYITDITYNAKELEMSKEAFVRRLLKLYPDESNLLVIDAFENSIPAFHGYNDDSKIIDFRYRGPSQNIKSIFAHPSRFIRQPDGKVILKPTDWNDVRFNFKYGGKMKNKSSKKMLGAALIGAASTLIGTAIQAANQRKLYNQQQEDLKKTQLIQNNNIRLNNLNQLANADMSWAYNKFNPTFKLGGQQKKNNIKFKNRFDK